MRPSRKPLIQAVLALGLAAPAFAGTAPDAVTDLRVGAIVSTGLGASSMTVTLSWTAPGEDGTTGVLDNSTFTIRYSSTTPILNDTDFANAKFSLDIATSGVSPGTLQSVSIPYLSAFATHYFVIKTTDSEGKTSTLSVGATAQAYAFTLAGTGGSSAGIAWGDYDNDGYLDAIVANRTGQDEFLLHSNHDGTFTKVTLTGTGGNSMGVAWGDYDNDGYLDAIVVNANGQDPYLLHNNRDGTFTQVVLTGVGAGTNGQGVAWGDYDNDGFLDAIVANGNGDPYLLHNKHDGTFTKVVLTGVGTGLTGQSVAWGDYDNDGYLDAVVVNNGGGQDPYLLHNDQHGNFTKVALTGVAAGANGVSAAWGDYDNDGYLDLIVVNGGQNHYLLHNNHDGTFTKVALNGTSCNAGGAAWGDYNNDGNMDAVVSCYGQTPFLLRNDGGGGFAKIMLPTPGGADHWGVSWGDYNNDGRLDAIIANDLGEDEVLLRNDGPAVNAAPTPPASGFSASFAEYSVTSTSGVLTLQWGSGSDDATPPASLTYFVRVGTAVAGSSTTLKVPARYGLDGLSGGGSRLYSTRVSALQRGIRLVMQKETTVYWAVTAEDGGMARSPESAEQVAGLAAPAAVVDLAAAQDASVETSSLAWVALTFTAPGEDGMAGDLQAGAVFDVRWSTFALDTPAKYQAAWNQALIPAQGTTAGAPTTKPVGVEPGRTYYFALTTKDHFGVRSGVSNSAAFTPNVLREEVVQIQPASEMQGNTTGFLKLQLKTDANTMSWTGLKVAKRGTLPDAAIKNVMVCADSNGNGVLDPAEVQARLTQNATFVSSAATLSFQPPVTLDASLKTYFVALEFQPDYLPVEGATVTVSLDGTAFLVKKGGVPAIDFPGMNFDGVDDVASRPYDISLLSLDLTAEAWVKTLDTGADRDMIVRGNAASGYRLGLGLSPCGAGVPSFLIGSNQLCANIAGVPVTVNDGKWHHVAAQYDRFAGKTMFVDGVPLSTETTSGSLNNMSVGLSLGGFTGQLDEVRLSKVVLYSTMTPFVPARRLAWDANTMGIYHFDPFNGAETTVKDSSDKQNDLTLAGGATGYARSGPTAVMDTQDILVSSCADVAPAVFFRNEQDVAVMKLSLWTKGDFATLNQLSVQHAGTGLDSVVTNLQLWLDDGDGAFDPQSDQSLFSGASFVGGKATFTLSGVGNAQIIGTSTKTYFITWTVLPGAQPGQTQGLLIPTTSEFQLAGSTDAMGASGIPAAVAPRDVTAALALVVPETATGTWVNVSSLVFVGNFAAAGYSGNVGYFRYIWDQSPLTDIPDRFTGLPWDATRLKTTATATTDAADWYLHARAFDSVDNMGTLQHLGPFWSDQTLPFGGSFLHYNSTGGALLETDFNDLVFPVTAQIQINDALAGLSLNGPAPVAPVNGCLLWRFDEPSGAVWLDEGASSNTLTVSAGTPVRAAGHFKTGILFDGVSELRSAAPKGLPLGNSPRTVEAWILPRSTLGVQGLVGWWPGAGEGLRLVLNNGQLAANLGGGLITQGPVLSTGVWQHVAFAFDGNWGRFYLNGQAVGSAAFGARATATGSLYVGSNDLGQRFIGVIDDLRIQPRALGAGEINDSWGRGNPFWVSYSTDAGKSWRVVTATGPWSQSYVFMTGSQGSLGPETLKVVGLDLVTSTKNWTGSSATNQVRFHSADTAGNVRITGPYGILADSVTPTAVSTPTFPGPGSYASPGTNFAWAGPSTPTVAVSSGYYYLQVSKGDPSFSPGSIVISVSTPSVVDDDKLTQGNGVAFSTFTIAQLPEGSTYYWRVRTKSALGMWGPWSSSATFVTDVTSSSVGGFLAYSSTGGAFTEGQAVDVLNGAAVQATVRDILAGLATSRELSPIPGTAGLWHFNETEGPSPQDASGVNTGAALACAGVSCSSATYTLTPFGAGLHCGNAQGMTVPNTQLNFVAGSSFTIEAWIKPNRTDLIQTIVALGAPVGSPDAANYSFGLNTSNLLFKSGSSAVTNTPYQVTIAPGVWQHVAMAARGDKVFFYQDGILRNIRTTPWSGTNAGPSIRPLTVCTGIDNSGVWGGFFIGDIDEIRILNYAAEPAQIAEDYWTSRPGRFGVEYSTRAGASWNVVTATYSVSGYPYLGFGGSQGATAPQALVLNNVNLAQSTSTATGSRGTNLIRYSAPDLAGNVQVSPPFSIVVDTVAAAAASTPSWPVSGQLVSAQPNFAWSGPSTQTVAQMGAAPVFLLEADSDPNFNSLDVAIATPVVVASTMAAAVQGVYVSTYTLPGGTTYWWRVRARDSLGVYSPPLAVGSFVLDLASPTAAGFVTYNATGGAVTEGIVNDLMSPVTAQLTVADAGPAGLAVTPADGAEGFGAVYTIQGTMGTPLWQDGTWGESLAAPGELGVTALETYQGKLYAGTGGTPKVLAFDGSAWTQTPALPAGTTVLALQGYNGKLYAGLSNGGGIRVYNGGPTWDPDFLPADTQVNALREYRGRLYAATGEQGNPAMKGRVYAYDPGSASWYLFWESPADTLLSLEVYNGRLWAGGNPAAYVFDGSTWTVAPGGLPTGVSYADLQTYSGKLYAASNFGGRVYAYDGSAWTFAQPYPGDNGTHALGVHGGRLYVGTDNPGLSAHVAGFDGKDWGAAWLYHHGFSTGDGVTSFKEYGGRLYTGLRLAGGGGSVQVSTPLAVSLTGADGTTLPQTLTLKGMTLAKSPTSTVCGGVAPCLAGNQVRLTVSDKAGLVRAAGPFAVLVDTLLSQPTAAYPASGEFVRYSSPVFDWVETSTMPKHEVLISSRASFSPLSIDVTTATPYMASPTALLHGTTYYWKVRAFNGLNVPSAYSAEATFVTDLLAPTASSFAHMGSTGGVLAEVQISSLIAGGTVQLTVQDAAPNSGLSVLTPGAAGGRVAVWHFDEPDGPIAYDTSGSGRNGQLAAGALRGEGAVGRGLAFDGSPGRNVDLPPAGGAAWPAGLTVSAWVKLTTANAQNSTIWASPQFRLQARSQDGLVRYEADPAAGGGCQVLTSTAYPTNIWTYVAFEMDPVAMQNQLYVNGRLAAFCGGAGNAADATYRLGQDGLSGLGGLDPFTGQLDEARVFSRAVPPAELETERLRPHYFVLYSTTAGADWQVVGTETPGAGPYLAFTAADGSQSPETLRVQGLSLVESTSPAVCNGTVPCGATNQVRFYIPDRAGNVRAAGPYSVLIDTYVPPPTLTSLTPLTSDTLYVTASATDDLSGLDAYLFDVSTAPDFTGGVISSSFTAYSTYTFTGLLTATTYYARVRTRDALFNGSAYAGGLSTSTFGTIYYSTGTVIPASALQNGAVPMIRFTLATPAGTSKLLGVRVTRTGDSGDAAVVEARIYKDNGDGVFSGLDTPLAGAPFVSSAAVIMLPTPQTLTVNISTFFVVYQIFQEAPPDATVGAQIASGADIFLPPPNRAEGVFPTSAGPIPISDGANMLDITPANMAPTSSVPGAQDVPLLKLTAQTDIGVSILSSLVVRLSGTLPPTHITAVRLWRDANMNGSFDAGDDLISAGDDLFDGNGVSTMTLTVPASSRTATTMGQRFFLTASVGPGAPLGAGFQVRIATASDVRLANPADTPVFTAEPVISSTMTVLRSNVVTVSPTDTVPASFTQGERYVVVRATLTVDQGFAEINRVQVDRSGTAQNADIEAAEVYRDLSADGRPFNRDVDVFIGSAAFTGGGGQALVDVVKQTLNSGTTYVFFIVYKVSPGASPGRTLGASLANSGYFRTVNPMSAVAGPFPIQTSTATIKATVNRLLLPSAASVAPGGLEQGARDVPMLRFEARSDKNDISWLGLLVQRLGSGSDSDVSAVKVWLDNGDGAFDAGQDTQISGGADVFPGNGLASIPLTVAQTVSASTRSYFVTLSVSPSAQPGGTLGVSVATSSAFNIGSPNMVSTETAVFPMNGGPMPVTQFPNNISVATASIVPMLGAEPGLTNIGMVRLELRTDVSNAHWVGLRLDQVGSAVDSDVGPVKVYYDVNDAGYWDASNLANYHLVTSTSQRFGQAGPGTVNLGFYVEASTPPVLGPVVKRYFVTVDLATCALPGRNVAVRAINYSYFQVDAPNQVSPTSFVSGPLAINAPPEKLYVLGTSSAPAQAVQGTTNVPMLALKLHMSSYTGQWSRLQVTRTGTGLDTDVTGVKLFRDSNGNGTLDVLTDERLSTAAFSGGSALLSFATQTITTSTQTYFLACDFAVTAVPGDTVGLELGAPGVFTVGAPHSADSLGFPIDSSTTAVAATQTSLYVTSQNKAPGTLVQGAINQVMLGLSLNTTQYALQWSGLTVQKLGTAADSDIRAVHIWKDVNGNGVLDPGVDQDITSGMNGLLGGTAVVSLVNIQSIGTTYERYFVTVDVAPYATPGRTFGLTVASTGSFTVSSPNLVAPDNFPHASAVVPLAKLSEQLVVTPADLPSPGVNQGAEVALARLQVRASRNMVQWTRLRLAKTGTLADAGVTSVRVWRDTDLSGSVTASDVLVGSASFSAGLATVVLSSAQTVGVSTQTYLVTFQLHASATIDATAGFTLQDASYLAVDVPDTVSSAGLPFSTSLSRVLDAHTPTKPVVTVDGGFSSNFEYLHFTWSSVVTLGSLSGAAYAVGTTPGGTDVLPYTSLAVGQTDMKAAGFPLLGSTTYYVSVKTQSDTGFWSPVGTSIGVLMDFFVPAKPAPTFSAGTSAILATWASVSGGVSGLMGYLIEYRTGDSPIWYNAKTRAQSASSVRTVAAKGVGQYSVAAVTADEVVTGNSFQLTGVPEGTILLRMRAVSNAGVASEPSAVSRVQLGALPKDGITKASSYPNPFDSRKEAATITYTAAGSADVTIKIFSVFGRQVANLGFQAGGQGGLAGSNEVRWDGTDDAGRKVSKGIYLAVIESGGAKATLKIGVIH